MKNRTLDTGIIRTCLLCLVLPACLSAGAQVQELYLKGIALADRSAYREARMSLEEALRYDDDNPDYLLKLAETCRNSGDPAAARLYLQQLEAIDPGKGSYLLATIYASEGNTGEAVKQLEMHLRSPYRLPPDHILLDEAFSSIEDSREWKALWSQNWYTGDEELMQEIRYMTSSGDYLQALETIDAELKKRVGWQELHEARGNVLLEMGQFQGAVLAYTRALEINAADPASYYGRAQAYLAQKKYDRAIPDLERSYRMEPEKLDLLVEIGQLYHQAGIFTKAAEYLERYAEYYPDRPEAIYLLGQVEFDSGNYLDALRQFNACLRIEKGDPRFYAARGRTYLETGTYRYALNDFGMALDLDPDDRDVWYMRGLAHWNLNDREGALGDWKRASRMGSYEAAEKLAKHGGGK